MLLDRTLRRLARSHVLDGNSEAATATGRDAMAWLVAEPGHRKISTAPDSNQPTTHRACLEAVEGAFRADVDHAQPVKLYSSVPGPLGRYSPAKRTGIEKTHVEGKPDIAHAWTSYVERKNLTMRMQMRRFTRLTNAFSKKAENHFHALALYLVFYNLGRILKTLRVTPAMAAGVSDQLLSWEDFEAMVESHYAKPAAKRSPYKKRGATVAE